MKSMNKKKNAFTLVELIVVITIVGILSTIGFVAYSGYLGWARDGNRIASLTKLSDSLQTYAASKSLPLPDDAINIYANGTSNQIAYQWKLGENVLETIDFTNGGKDPKDDAYYTYYLTNDRKNLQLLAFLEEDSVAMSPFSQSFAADYSTRFPKVYGKKLGVILYNDTASANHNKPIEDLSATYSSFDVVTQAGTTFKALISDSSDPLIGSWLTLRRVIPTANCDRIKEVGDSKWDGVYKISPAWVAAFDAYCDMTIDGGGWTLIARTYKGQTINLNGTTGNVSNDSAPYSIPTTNLYFTEEMLAKYSNGKMLNGFVKGTDWLKATTSTYNATVSGSTISAAGNTTSWTFTASSGAMLFVR